MKNPEIDARVGPLVDELNQFPGVETFASCGGHTHVSKKDLFEGKVRQPDFYVSFTVDPTVEALWSVRLISWAAFEASVESRVLRGAALMMWVPTPEPIEPPKFDLYCRIDVGLMLKKLQEAREYVKAFPSKNAGEGARDKS
jgi:hypothetical protein